MYVRQRWGACGPTRAPRHHTHSGTLVDSYCYRSSFLSTHLTWADSQATCAKRLYLAAYDVEFLHAILDGLGFESFQFSVSTARPTWLAGTSCKFNHARVARSGVPNHTCLKYPLLFDGYLCGDASSSTAKSRTSWFCRPEDIHHYSQQLSDLFKRVHVLWMHTRSI